MGREFEFSTDTLISKNNTWCLHTGYVFLNIFMLLHDIYVPLKSIIVMGIVHIRGEFAWGIELIEPLFRCETLSNSLNKLALLSI